MYRECYPILMSICSRYFKNDLDSRAILNDAFLKIILNLEKRSQQIPFAAWIRRIMLNSIIDHYRNNKSYFENMELAELPQLQVVSQHDVSLQVHYDAEELLSMVRELPPMTNRVFNLFAIEGYTHSEIAEVLHISEGTSKWHVSTARKLLNEKLQMKNHTPVKMKKG